VSTIESGKAGKYGGLESVRRSDSEMRIEVDFT